MTGSEGMGISAVRFKELSEKYGHRIERLRRFLTFSPADESVAYGRAAGIVLEKDGVLAVSASRMFSKARITGFRRFRFEEGRPAGHDYPQSFYNSDVFSWLSVRSVTLSVPKSWVFIRTVELPAAVKEDVAGVVAYELDRLTPFGADEAYFDFLPLGERDGKMTVLIAASPAAAINKYVDMLKEKGIGVERVTFNVSAGGTLCRYVYGAEDFAYVEVDTEGYEGALHEKGRLMHAFSGVFEEREPRAMAQAIASEIESVRGKGELPLMASLKDEAARPLKDALKESIGGRLEIVEDAVPGARRHHREGLTFSAAGSVIESLWPGANAMNLLSKGVKSKAKTPKALTSLMVVLIVILAAFNVFIPVIQEEKRLGDINRSLSLRISEAKKVEALKQQIADIQAETARISGFKNKNKPANSLMHEISTLLPPSAWLTRFRITDGNAELEGYASSATAVLTRLEGSEHFGNAEFYSPVFKDASRNAERFAIRMELEGITPVEETGK